MTLRGPPMTLGNAASAQVRLIVWCRERGRQIEPDPAEMAELYGAEITVIDWHARLVCSGCGKSGSRLCGHRDRAAIGYLSRDRIGINSASF